jgi:hypothetical protein
VTSLLRGDALPLAGARISDARAAACGVAQAGLSLPARGCRQCTRVAVAATVPRKIALGSACDVRASSIVMRDSGEP